MWVLCGVSITGPRQWLVVIRTDGQEPPASPTSNESCGNEHADVLRPAEQCASDETEGRAVYHAGFATPAVHYV
jgi:hypothetical protein